ncbi:MAG: hypothetical protein ABWX67_02340 [Allosphingosinicella sp.]
MKLASFLAMEGKAMRGMVILAALLLGLAGPALAQPARPDSLWNVSDERLSLPLAKLSAPRRAAGAEYFETMEFSHKGEGVDSAIKYRTADRQIFATLYVYYPSLAHTGVQAIATDHAIRGSSNPPTARPLGTAIAAAGGQPGVAVTADYDHYLGDHFSKAAFVKAGRWMLKLRVSGPQERSGEVTAVMTALLDGLRFEGETRPRPAAPISARECGPADRADARALSDDDLVPANAMLATFDPAGQPAANAPAGDQTPLLARIGRDWCRTTLRVGDDEIAVLQATGGERRDGLGGDSALLVLFSDAGGALEVVRLAKEKKYLLLRHDIAEVEVLGSYDGLPSLAQIGRLFSGSPTRVRARVRLKPNGGTEINLPTPPAKAPDRTSRAAGSDSGKDIEPAALAAE